MRVTKTGAFAHLLLAALRARAPPRPAACRRHGVEEVNADQPAGVLERGGDLLDGQRRGVGGEHRAGLQFRLDFREQLLLGFEVFEDRLDHHVGAVGLLAFRVGDEPRRWPSWRPHPSRRRFLKKPFARSSALSTASADTSCSETSMPCATQTMAMSAPMVPAPMTWARSGLKPCLRRLGLQHFGQLEHAAQIARLLRDHQRREDLGLLALQALVAAAVLFEQVDQPEGRRDNAPRAPWPRFPSACGWRGSGGPPRTSSPGPDRWRIRFDFRFCSTALRAAQRNS